MTSPLKALLDNLKKAHPERLKRAAEQGYDTDKVYLHRTNSDIDKFIKPEQYQTSFPSDELSREFVFGTSNPELASEYANVVADLRSHNVGANVVPYFVRGSKKEVDAVGDNFDMVYPEHLQNKSHDNYIFSNVSDDPSQYGIEDLSEVIATNDPSNIRSIFANFDPAKQDSSNLLASLALPAALTAGGAAMFAPDSAEASTGSRIVGGLEVLINPKQKELYEIARNDPYSSVRVAKDAEGDTYAWSAANRTHDDIAKALNKSFYDHEGADIDEFFLYDGVLASRSVQSEPWEFMTNNPDIDPDDIDTLTNPDMFSPEETKAMYKNRLRKFAPYSIAGLGAASTMLPEPAEASLPDPYAHISMMAPLEHELTNYFGEVKNSAKEQAKDSVHMIAEALRGGEDRSMLGRLGEGSLGLLGMFGIPETALLEPVAQRIYEKPLRYPSLEEMQNYD